MPRLPRLSSSQLLTVLRRAGFVQGLQAGSHLTLKNHETCKRVTIVMGHKDYPVGLLRRNISKAGLTVEEVIAYHKDKTRLPPEKPRAVAQRTKGP